MLAKKGDSAGKAVLPIIIIVLAGFILWLVFMPAADRADLIGSDEPVEDEYYNELLPAARPGVLRIENETIDTLEISINEITVDGRPKERSVKLGNSIYIERSWIFRNTNWEHSFVENGTIMEAELSFNVLEKRKSGALYVKINGKKIFSEEIDKGETIKVSVPVKYINEGENNIAFNVEAGFMGNAYELADIFFIKQEFDDKSATAKESFGLEPVDVVVIQDAKLKMMISKLSDATSRILNISLNNETIYESTPALEGKEEIDIPTDIFRDNNQLIITTEPGSGYKLTNLKFELEQLNASDVKVWEVIISNGDWDRIQSEKYDCKLIIERASGDTSVRFKVNEYAYSQSFSNDKIEQDVCDRLKEDSNYITLLADTAGGSDGLIDVSLVKLYLRDK